MCSVHFTNCRSIVNYVNYHKTLLYSTKHIINLIRFLFCDLIIIIFFCLTGTPATPATPANIMPSLPDWASQISNSDTMAAVAQILQSPQGQQVSPWLIF